MSVRRCVVLALCALLLASCSAVSDWVAQRYSLPREGVRPAAHRVVTERRVGFTTSDGVVLRADVHRPIGPEKTPVILARMPITNTFWNRFRADRVGRYWASRGYTVVVQGTRGRYESDGEFYPLRHERQDGIETLRWIGEQPWFDGRLAMWGGSAFGQTQWAIADQTDPGADAYFIQIAGSRFADLFHVDGAFALETALYWALLSHGPEDVEVDPEALDRGEAGFPAIDADARGGVDVDFFNDWALNDPSSEYWRTIDGEDRAAQTAAPALLLAGWYDPFLRTMIEDFATLRANPATADSRLIIGPYAHARPIAWPSEGFDHPYRIATIDPTLAWFDHRLGLTDAPLDTAPVRIFVLGENVWRDEREWPLARTQYAELHLASDGDARLASGGGTLAASVAASGAAWDAYVYDPQNPAPTAGGAMLGPRSGVRLQNDVEMRDDVLVYSTEPLAEPLEVTGPLRVVLYVSTDAPSTDFTAKLVDVHPDGSAYNIADGILRRSYAPGEPTRIEIDLGATSILFPAGHRIRLEVSSSNYPRFDRNPNTGESAITATETRIARQTVWHDAERPSHILLPVIPR